MQTTAMFTQCKSENNRYKYGRNRNANIKCFLKRWRMGADWIKLAQNMVRWRNVAQTVKKLRDVQGPHYIRTGSSLSPYRVLISVQGPHYIRTGPHYICTGSSLYPYRVLIISVQGHHYIRTGSSLYPYRVPIISVQGPHYIRQISFITSPHNCTVV